MKTTYHFDFLVDVRHTSFLHLQKKIDSRKVVENEK